MPREIAVLFAIRHRRPDWELLCSDYRARVSRFVSMHEAPVKVRRPAQDERSQLRLEGGLLRAALPARGFAVALERRGKSYDSVQLAAALAGWLERTRGPVVFVLGSDLGLDPSVLVVCAERLSLGPLTLPHELARLVLYEQLYRALSIGAGIGYHRGPLS